MNQTNVISADFPYESKYIEVKGSRIHFIDEGTGDPVLFLHGNPTSSYLWRNVIPHLNGQARCIAPDLIGMGKSDQPDINYGFKDTFEYLDAFIKALGLTNVTLVLHDWGSGLGFHYAHLNSDNIKGIVFMEAVYRLLDWKKLPGRFKVGMTLMRLPVFNWLMLGAGNLFVKKVIPNGITRTLLAQEFNTYKTPYPNIKSRKPVRVWPKEIPIKGKPLYTHQIVSAYHEWLKTTEIPKLCIYANPGMLIPIEEIQWIKANLTNITTVHVGKGRHFIQEDEPHKIGEAISVWYDNL